MLLRDKRTIFFSIVLPILVLPLVLIVANVVERRQAERIEARTVEYAVTGDAAELGRRLVQEAASLRIPGDSSGAFAEVAAASPDSALRHGELHVVVEALGPERAAAIRDSIAAAAANDADTDEEDDRADAEPDAYAADVPLLRLHYRGNSDMSRRSARRLRDRLRTLRDQRRDALFRTRGLPVEPDRILAIDYQDAARPERAAGALLGMALTPILVFMMLTGGAVVAADAISGEKERGTLETLLTTAVRRADIVAAKQLLIISVALAITVINVANLLVYLVIGVFDLPPDFAISLSPLAVFVLLLLYLPLTILVSSVLLLVSGYSQSYKEFQIYFFPVFLLLLLPTAAGILPGIDLRSGIALVPIANVSTAVREVMVGEYDWPFLALVLGVTAAAAAWLARVTTGFLSTERLITATEDRAEIAGGPALFPRRVLRWFATLWAIFFVSALWLGPDTDIRVMLSFNLIGLFLGGSLLMIWRYGLDPRKALALRPVRPIIWLAVLIGVPSASLTGIGVFKVASYIFPVPDRVLEAFGELLLPETIPLWQLVLFLAILPGICEEIAFRGVLLYGLRRRLRPIPLALAVGAIFGFFHVDLFRLLPTAYLGVVFAAVTLMTGSIFPAMLWHALNNAWALITSRIGYELDASPTSLILVGFAGLAVSFWIIWRNRTPYPGLRTGNAEGRMVTEARAAPSG